MSQPDWWSPAAQYVHNQPPSRRDTQNFYLPPNVNQNPGPRRNHKGDGHGAKISVGLAVGMALIAGAIGGVAGNLANGSSLFDSQASLVATTNVVERSPESVSAIAARVLPSVVSIATRSSRGGGTGTGFVIRSDGYILTNNHVVENVLQSGTLNVSFNDGKVVRGKIVGVNAAYDLAVIKVTRSGVPALQFGDSDKIQVGDSVIAVGSPLGLSGTVTSGIISAKNRAVTAGDGESESSFINALQTDAAINPGNSGGPLVDKTGAVVGVNSAIATVGSSFGSQSGSIGLGFAIPINQARRTAEELIKTGKSSYPILGVSVDINYGEGGARVASLSPNGPAESAGIEVGDIIIELGGRKISNSDELIVAIRDKAPGDRVSITVKRNEVTKVLKATLVAAEK
jgi:putative serine protease PepD